MSYDVTLVQERYSSNYTSNIYPIVDKAFKVIQERGDVDEYYAHWASPMTKCLDSEEGVSYLRKLILEIEQHPEIYEPLQPEVDPKTGERWGSYKGCIEWLTDILKHWEMGYRLEVDW